MVGEGAVSEATLYAPVKLFLERLGYEVKGEVRGCDLVARRGDEPPVIVELKLRFNLALVLQGNVYGWFERLGRGTYRVSDRGREALGQFAESVAALADPGAVPRSSGAAAAVLAAAEAAAR